MKNLKLFELIAVVSYTLFSVLYFNYFNTWILMIVFLAILNAIWIMNVINTMNNNKQKRFNNSENQIIDIEDVLEKPKFKNNVYLKILEYLCLSLFLWALTFNLINFNNTCRIIILSTALLALFYFFDGLIGIIIKKRHWLDSLEKLLFSLILLGFLFRLMHWYGALVIFVLAIFVLALSMFINAFISLIKNLKLNQITIGIFSFIIYFNVSTLLIYILFDFMFWPNIKAMFYIPFFIIILSLIVLFIVTPKTQNNFQLFQSTLKRSVVILSIALFFHFTTMYEFYRLEFGNRPNLINLRVNCQMNTRSIEELTSCFSESELYKNYREGNYQEGE